MPPGTRNALVPPSPNYLRDAGQFVGGVGRSLLKTNVTGPLELVQQSYYDPYALGQGVVQGVAQFAQDPVGAVGNSLRSMWNRAKSSPAGLGEVVGENIDPRNWLKPRKVLRHELDVYHGTPHTFEPEEGAPLGKFRSNKIGTGEGAQAYGYGLYLAEDQDVADAYRVKLSYDPEKMRIGGKQINEVYSAIERNAARMPPNKAGIEYEKMELLEQLMTNDSLNKVAKRASEMSPEAAQWFEKQVKPTFETYGRNYKVDLPDAKIEQMLDWDKPLSQQPKSILNVAQSVANDVPDGIVAEILREEGIKGFASGGDLYRSIAQDLGSDSYASQALLTEGKIPGIKYLDAGSRGSKKRTRNFVVFPGEEQNLTILSRD